MARPDRASPGPRAVVPAIAVIVMLLMASCVGGETGGDARPGGTTAPTGPTGRPPDKAVPPLEQVVVKIDNVSAARPQSGLAMADVTYVEPVEGGFTRLAAVYSARLPEVVGPVRSARESDVELLAQYGDPALVCSGAAPEVAPMLERSLKTLVRPGDAPRAFFRDSSRAAPHNLYVRPGEVPTGTGPGPAEVFRFGPAPPGGAPTAEHTVAYGQAQYRLVWSAREGRWLVRLDGTPVVSTGAGQVGAATVVVQRVPIERGAGVTDATGAPSPVARTVGQGPATVLRDGRAYSGTWSRPSPREGTTFTTGSGQPVPLAQGPVWVLLVPA